MSPSEAGAPPDVPIEGRLAALHGSMCEGLLEREDAARVLLLAALAGEHELSVAHAVGLRVSPKESFSRAQMERYDGYAKELGAPGLAWFLVEEAGSLRELKTRRSGGRIFLIQGR